MTDLRKFIRDVPDFPKKGIVFKDITPLLKDPAALRSALALMAKRYRGKKIDKVVSMESRGFIFGSALAYLLKCGFVPVRKKGKLPSRTYAVTYALEYGTDTLEIHCDAIEKGDRVVIVDDVLATGGTAKAVIDLLKKTGGKVVGCSFLIELGFLNGRKNLKGTPVSSLVDYQ